MVVSAAVGGLQDVYRRKLSGRTPFTDRLKHHFAVAGDFNLVLLDELLKNKELEQVYCCNELNCGYAAEGYARACGAAAAVVTFSVGGLSAINAIGGAYAENLPVILVSGATNTNDAPRITSFTTPSRPTIFLTSLR
jgi:thiamine pyrophosphate-dependent acetolactate synthase large subunit-like protein